MMWLVWVLAVVDTLAATGVEVVVGPGVLSAPEALAWSPRGGFWVADRGTAARLHFFTSAGMRQRSFGAAGHGGVEFTDRIALADPGGQFVYAADTDGSRILKLTRDGVPVKEIRRSTTPGAWTWKPRALASLRDGRVFVVDETSGHIQVTDPFDGLRDLGGASDDAAGVMLPAGLATDGRILAVTDQGAGTVRRVDLHGNELGRLDLGGAPGSVAIREDGLLAVVDDDARVVKIAQDGRVAVLVIGGARSWSPRAICFTADGALLVADREGDRILRVELPQGQ